MKTHGNERDLEIPLVLDFVRSRTGYVKPTLLDVGCHASGQYYADEMRKLVGVYDGVDLLYDERLVDTLDSYFLSWEMLRSVKYDIVTCVSTIEHSGISTYKSDDFHQERASLVAKMYDLQKDGLFISCPFGTEHIEPGQFANVTESDLSYWETRFELSSSFWYTPGPHRGDNVLCEFEQVEREWAAKQDFPEDGFTRLIAIIEA